MPATGAVPPLLVAHLRTWLGAWPPRTPLEIVGHAGRDRPGWDGRVHPIVAVRDALGSCLVSVPPRVAPAAMEVSALGFDALLAALPALLGQKPRCIVGAVLRWTNRPAALDDAGEWVASTQPGLPDWLRRFPSHVLVAKAADGTPLSAVGIKHHDAYGRELAVGTARGAEGRGLARRLVAQAARAVRADGALPTYLHDPSNAASSRVAEAAGFPDRGWSAFGLED